MTTGQAAAAGEASDPRRSGPFVEEMSRRPGDAPSLKQIYTAQEYAVRAVQTIDRRRRAARRAAVLAARTSVPAAPSSRDG